MFSCRKGQVRESSTWVKRFSKRGLEMKYHTLGRSGLKVAPLAVGTFNFGGPSDKLAALEIISIALENGVNLFDTADSYRKGASEQMLGECLAELGRRNDVIIATKVHLPTGSGPNDFGNSRHHIIRSCEESLRRLKSNHIDLLQLHRPSFDIPIDETLGALTDLVRQGKARQGTLRGNIDPSWLESHGSRNGRKDGRVCPDRQ